MQQDLRPFVAVAALALACTAAHAQKIMERIERDPPKNAQKKESKSKTEPERRRHVEPERRRHVEPERRRHTEPQKAAPKTAAPSTKFPPDQGARIAPIRPTTPPSQAEQLQRQIEEDRRLQRREPRASEQSGAFRCSAHPVCDRSSGSYGNCRGVERTYSGKSLLYARQDVARQCVDANTPDTCNCAIQCSRVAHCSSI